MKPRPTAPNTIDAYVAMFPKDVRAILQRIRRTIKRAAPGAKEAISYLIPAFKLHGNLIFFAAFKKHIGLYPAPRSAAEFRKELSAYKGGKGTVQFPLDKPIPYDLITRIVKFRVKQNQERAKAKQTE